MTRTIAGRFLVLAATILCLTTCALPYPGNALAAGPSVSIASPRDRDTLTLPATVRFSVTGLKVARGEGQIKVYMEGIDDSPVVTLEPTDEPGVATFPAHKMFSGRRNLTFALAATDGKLFENAEARVTIKGVIVHAGR
jgi:hypothetical protein